MTGRQPNAQPRHREAEAGTAAPLATYALPT